MLRAVRHLAVAAIGRDRPGIVAAVTRNLLEHECNVEDSQMTILGGHFTMMLVVAGGDAVSLAALRADLEATARELSLEAISVEAVADVAGAAARPTHSVTVYGVDHPGIVHAVSAALAQCEVNITDLNTRLVVDDDAAAAANGDAGERGDDLYAMMLEVVLPEGLTVKGLDSMLEATRREQGVEISIRELEHDTA
jgi:glycine cleavage system transcriptional repressor